MQVGTLCPQKSGPPTDGDSFVKIYPLFKTLSPLERGVNSKQKPHSVSHHTRSMLPDYRWKIKV